MQAISTVTVVIGLVPQLAPSVPAVSLLTTTTKNSLHYLPRRRAGFVLRQPPPNRRSLRHTFQQMLRTGSNASFLHPLRFRVTTIGLAGL